MSWNSAYGLSGSSQTPGALLNRMSLGMPGGSKKFCFTAQCIRARPCVQINVRCKYIKNRMKIEGQFIKKREANLMRKAAEPHSTACYAEINHILSSY